MNIVFLPSMVTVDAEYGSSVLAAAAAAGLPLSADCHGSGRCGKCRVIIDGRECLACRVSITREMEVYIPEGAKDDDRKKDMSFLPQSFAAETGKGYGIAFDIGTTTVVGLLWDLKSGTLIGTAARTNDQSACGADVISRIEHTLRSGDGLAELHEKTVFCLNAITEQLCTRSGVAPQRICRAVAVGNATMSHLLWGVSPATLARAPFAPAFTASRKKTAGELGLSIHPEAPVYLLPNVAGHVGSDFTALLLAAETELAAGTHLAVDIGTNGEIAAVKNGRVLCCSTAAGPAFEGAHIRQGMRAASGAVARLLIASAEEIESGTEPVTVRTVDNAPAIGICGSGLIDAAAELSETGLLTEDGRLLTRAEAAAAGLPAALTERLITVDGTNAFVIAENGRGRVLLTQDDIREVQLAKAAIAAGIKTLMKLLDITEADIDSILSAGAFGSSLPIESALRIGLLPRVEKSRIRAIGNAAGSGASMALLSEESRRRADALAEKAEHIELSAQECFQKFYIDAMNFG